MSLERDAQRIADILNDVQEEMNRLWISNPEHELYVPNMRNLADFLRLKSEELNTAIDYFEQ